MKKTFYFTKEELIDFYINKNMKRNEIAKYYGCSDILIKKKLKEFDIKKPKELENENKRRRVKKKCLNCNEEFEVVRFRSKGKWTIKFCSHSCSSQFRYLGEKHKRAVLNAIAARRRARLYNASIDLTKEEWEEIKVFYKKTPKGYEVDHKKPLSKGGLHHPNNLQYLTVSENRKKHDKII